MQQMPFGSPDDKGIHDFRDDHADRPRYIASRIRRALRHAFASLDDDIAVGAGLLRQARLADPHPKEQIFQ